MPLILPVHGVLPQIPDSCFVAENATLVGDVQMGERCSVWFQAVVRGDVNSITTGDEVNIQDGAVIHCTYQKFSTSIGNRVSIGHKAIVHGCTIGDEVLVGMGAIVMDGAVVESQVLIAAGAVVLQHAKLESGYLYAGTPAKKLKALTTEQLQMLKTTPDNYIKYSGWFGR